MDELSMSHLTGLGVRCSSVVNNNNNNNNCAISLRPDKPRRTGQFRRFGSFFVGIENLLILVVCIFFGKI